MDGITAWMHDPQASFDEGFILFCQRSRNQHLKNYLARKRDMRKLRYELGKFAPKTTTKIYPQIEVDLCQKPHERLTIVRAGEIKFENLPEEIKSVYLDTVEMYREMRSLHEQLKIARLDCERITLREQLISKDTQRSEKWAIIDQWGETGELPQGQDPNPETYVEIANYKSVAAARTAVTRYVKELEANPEMDETKRNDLIGKTRQAVAVVTNAGGKFDKLADPLRNLGILDQ